MAKVLLCKRLSFKQLEPVRDKLREVERGCGETVLLYWCERMCLVLGKGHKRCNQVRAVAFAKVQVKRCGSKIGSKDSRVLDWAWGV